MSDTTALALASVATFAGRVTHADARTLLASLPDACVQLIAIDPPYNMRKAEWDTFDSDAALVAWLGEHFAAMRRVLAPNGSVYVFCNTRLQAETQLELKKHFRILNNIRWQKPPHSTKAEMFDKDMMRAYFPASETIIFAEQYGSDKPYNSAVIDGESDFWTACETAKRGIFGDYLNTEFNRANVTRKEIAALFPSRTGGLTGCVSNWLLGYNCPTPEQYAAMRDYLNTHHKNGAGEYLRQDYEELRQDYEELRQDYEYLRQDYEELRRAYEHLRRPFTVSPDAPYTDVWTFPTVNIYPGKHPAEKPLDLMRHIVRASSRPDDLVLDCFAGSGTTLRAAHIEKRRYIGGDSDAHWCVVARRKLAEPLSARVLTAAEQDVSDLPLFAPVAQTGAA